MIAGLERRVEQEADEDERGDDGGDDRARHTPRAQVGALGVRELLAQEMNDDHLQEVREHRAPDRDVQHDRAGDAHPHPPAASTSRDKRDEADDRPDDEGDPRRLPLAGEREELRVVPGAGQRVHVAPVGEHDALQRGEQADEREEREHRGRTVADDRAEAVEQGLARAVPVASAPITPVLRNSTSRPVTIRVPRAQNPAFGMSRAGLWDSSAASGSSSMPRKNHIANGRANRIGSDAVRQERRSGPRRARCRTACPRLNWPEKIAIAEKTSRIAMEMIDTTMANLKEMLAPAELSAMKTT